MMRWTLPRRFAGGFPKLSQEGSCGRAPMDDSHGREECPEAPGARRGRSTAFSKSLLRSDWDSPCEAHTFTPASKDRKSTRLNSSHVAISYAVFCLKKKITEN